MVSGETDSRCLRVDGRNLGRDARMTFVERGQIQLGMGSRVGRGSHVLSLLNFGEAQLNLSVLLLLPVMGSIAAMVRDHC